MFPVEPSNKFIEQVCMVPGWLYGMPEEWWLEYFDKVQYLGISPYWGNA